MKLWHADFAEDPTEVVQEAKEYRWNDSPFARRSSKTDMEADKSDFRSILTDVGQ